MKYIEYLDNNYNSSCQMSTIVLIYTNYIKSIKYDDILNCDICDKYRKRIKEIISGILVLFGLAWEGLFRIAVFRMIFICWRIDE